MKRPFLMLLALLCSCGSTSYRPVQESSFDRLIDEGCARKGDRFSVSARINSASRETIVLWDGYDGSRSIAVRLPEQGMGSKMRGWVGKSRYELGYERLNEVRVSGAEVEFTMRCDGTDQAPATDRFSYLDNGRRVQFEF